MTTGLEKIELKLIGMGIAPFSSRNCEQTLAPIDDAAYIRRTTNGVLVDLSNPNFRKYASTISCEDLQAPALSGIWGGMELTVHCITELVYKVPDPDEGTPGDLAERPIVSGSLVTRNGFRYYRPILTMLVLNYEIGRPEWEGKRNWQLELEEV